MNYRAFGRTGVRVSTLCLGTLMLGAWGNADRSESIRIIHCALDAGINFIDTADGYSNGESEEIVGEALHGRRRDNVILATKVHGAMGSDPNQQGNSRRWIMREVENSLRRLRTDHLDLYQVHRPDPTCDIDETLSAMTDLVRAGKVRYIGCSNFPAHEIVRARWESERRGLATFVCEQSPYSILTRGIEADVLPVILQYDMAAIVWSPLSGGMLSGRYRRGVQPQPSPREILSARWRTRDNAAWARKVAAAELLGDVADTHGLTVIDLALAFVLNHPAVTAAIIGPRTMEQLRVQLPVTDVSLSTEVLDAIDEIVPAGTNLDPGDLFSTPPGLDPSKRRR